MINFQPIPPLHFSFTVPLRCKLKEGILIFSNIFSYFMSSKWLQASFKVALHMTLPDKQRYLRNYYMISNVEDIVVFLGLKLSNSDKSDI